jgi:hypothetical protein
MSIRLHQTERVLVMSHLTAPPTAASPISKATSKLKRTSSRRTTRAGDLLTANFPDISVEPYFVKFDGIWGVQGADHLRFARKEQPTRVIA